ncbi:hypothetical protein AruPA_13460 [Acidiphilium sp. PA]|uniref:hypothetical protein n=1 Tax=Acidiphilium sp. PA TaxID=2871705 RepID=UPI002244314E|nr:hypothetical protein [Acidiphilium sp. PA]MCW8308049.1 hypothetical protein [Acidiphilium sp. PA]
MTRPTNFDDDARKAPHHRWSARFGLGGVISSFGCAACCALPIILAGSALAGAWTLRLQLLVGPYERWWLWGSIILMALSAVFWGREIQNLAKGSGQRVPVIAYGVTPLILLLGAVLLAGTLRIEHASLSDFL